MGYTEITNRNSPNFTKGRGGQKITSITIHWWGDPKQNPTAEGVVNWLCNTASGVSAHFVITGTGRRAWQLVNDGDTAWHAGNWNGNQTSLGLELDPRCRNEDYDVAAEVIAALWKYYGKLPLKKHKDWSNTACPGNYDIARLKKEAEAKLNPPKPQPVPVTVKSTQSFAAKTFIVKEDTKLVNIPADTQYNSTVYKKGSKITDAVELVTASNGKTFYRTKYARDTAKKMYGFKGNVLEEEKKPVPPVVVPPVIEQPDYTDINKRLTALEQLVKTIVDFLSGMFKGYK